MRRLKKELCLKLSLCVEGSSYLPRFQHCVCITAACIWLVKFETRVLLLNRNDPSLFAVIVNDPLALKVPCKSPSPQIAS
jgi:hypothetical protein